MAGDWDDMCEMFGQDVCDPDAIDNILTAIHADTYEDDEDYYDEPQATHEVHMDTGVATCEFHGINPDEGIGPWTIGFHGKDFEVSIEKYGGGGDSCTDTCDLFKTLCALEDRLQDAVEAYCEDHSVSYLNLTDENFKELIAFIEI